MVFFNFDVDVCRFSHYSEKALNLTFGHLSAKILVDRRFGGSLLPKLCVGEGFAEMRYFNAVHIHNRVLLDVLSTRRGVS